MNREQARTNTRFSLCLQLKTKKKIKAKCCYIKVEGKSNFAPIYLKCNRRSTSLHHQVFDNPSSESVFFLSKCQLLINVEFTTPFKTTAKAKQIQESKKKMNRYINVIFFIS